MRTVELDDGSCVVMAINPWQDETARSTRRVRCGAWEADIALEGRGTALAVLSGMGSRATEAAAAETGRAASAARHR